MPLPITRPSPSYPRPGATIDYYLPVPASDDITLEFLDAAGKHIKTFTSAAPAPQQHLRKTSQPVMMKLGRAAWSFRAAPG